MLREGRYNLVRSIKDIFLSYAEIVDGRHVNGTDKCTNHDYSAAYESLLPNRKNVKMVMEVGVADGSCLLAWREVFPNATIVGMDIHHSDKAHGDRIEFHLGDQRSLEDCRRAAAGRQFDLIVEDATHNVTDNLVTLIYLWPFVKPGGLYVIEEFGNVGALRENVSALWTNVEIVDTDGPFGGVEPLVVFLKSSR